MTIGAAHAQDYIIPDQGLVVPEQCFDEDGYFLVTPENFELCSHFPTEALPVRSQGFGNDGFGPGGPGNPANPAGPITTPTNPNTPTTPPTTEPDVTLANPGNDEPVGRATETPNDAGGWDPDPGVQGRSDGSTSGPSQGSSSQGQTASSSQGPSGDSGGPGQSQGRGGGQDR